LSVALVSRIAQVYRFRQPVMSAALHPFWGDWSLGYSMVRFPEFSHRSPPPMERTCLSFGSRAAEILASI
jgi:hypothetical protein